MGNRTITGLLIGLLLSAFPFGLSSANLLTNPDFSQWENDSTPIGWTVESRNYAPVTRENSQGQAAPPCLKITRLQAGTGNNRGIIQNCPVTAGQDYTVAVWLQTPTMPDTLQYASARVIITWRNASGAAIGSTSPAYIHQPIWTEQRYVATAPNNPNGDSIAASADIIIRCYGRTGSTPGGIVLVDDALFVQGAAATEPRFSPTADQPILRVLPNPAPGHARVLVNISSATQATVILYDLTGTERAVLHSGWLEAGQHELGLTTANSEYGRPVLLPDGLYFVVLKPAGRQPTVAKLLLQN